jgi:SpoVK/Ycf46/Vps4 family AAA+-type ATPase
LLRSGRLDRKIEFPHPNEEARARIMQIHSRKMTVAPDVNFEELARSCDEFNGAQCKAVCVEAGMYALRRGATEIQHEDFMEGKFAKFIGRYSRSPGKEKDYAAVLCIIKFDMEYIIRVVRGILIQRLHVITFYKSFVDMNKTFGFSF